jgi:hypothetical protein
MSGKWLTEEIPSQDKLYRFVHKQWFSKKTGMVSPDFFKNPKDPESNEELGMSTDWSKYSTPEETRGRAKLPEMNAVIEMDVADVRAISSARQQVEYTPIQGHPAMPDNRAHADVVGSKDDLEVKKAFARLSRIVALA